MLRREDGRGGMSTPTDSAAIKRYLSDTHNPRAARHTLPMATAKAKTLAKLAETPQFLLSLPGRWLTRWRAHGGPEPAREFRFCPTRKWRFDFCFPTAMVAIEIDGGTFIRGGHSRGMGQRRDMEKANAAACLRWSLLRFSVDMIRDEIGFDDAVQLVSERLKPKHGSWRDAIGCSPMTKNGISPEEAIRRGRD